MSTIVFIAGMHRSGTSALALLLHRLGCDIPGEIDMNLHHNALGHWEPVEFVKLNQQILQHWNSDWCELHLPELIDTTAQSIPFSDDLVTYIRESCSTTNVSVLKDPRVCYTLPLWLEATHHARESAIVVLPYRHPMEVALSLSKRDNMPMDVALALWLCNMLSAEYSSRSTRRCAVSYENLLLDWRAACTPILELTGISIPDHTDPRHATLSQAIDRGQRHHSVADANSADTSSQIHTLAIETYNLFDQPLNATTTLAAFDDLRRRVTTLIHEQGLVAQAHIYTKQYQSQRAIAERDAEIVWLHKTIAEIHVDYQKLLDMRATEIAEIHVDYQKLLDMRATEIVWLQDTNTTLTQSNTVLTEEIIWLREINTRLTEEHERLRYLRLIHAGFTKISVFWHRLWKKPVLTGSVAKEMKPAHRRLQFFAYVLTRFGFIGAKFVAVCAVLGRTLRISIVPQELSLLSRYPQLFDVRFYQSNLQNTVSNPLYHYLQIGDAINLRPNALFDPATYRMFNMLPAETNTNTLCHYIIGQWNNGKGVTSYLFDSHWYLQQNPDVSQSGYNPLAHYLGYGFREFRNPSPIFDIRNYRARTPQLPINEEPIAHFLQGGYTRFPSDDEMLNPLSDLPFPVDTALDLVRFATNARVPLTTKEINTKRIVLSQLINQNTAVHHLSPTVSIVIPVYNQLKYTITAVESILRSTTKVTYEILIIDDCSTDETAQFFAALTPLRCITQPTNQGFIAACNRGAIEARGDYIVFLNNDVHVLPGWLDGLYDTFALRNNIGLVGSQLIYPDGFLQEAGGIIWADGRGWNYGRGAYPMQPEYTYLRPVDYCSGASIMVPTQLFASLGGFATEYQPAYYEDVDLAMKTRAEGYEVIYQPSSKVVHFEGVSSGRDMTSGTKAYQTRNHELFVKKWSYDMGSRPMYASEPDKAAVRNFRGRILFADATTPTPDQDAGSVVADMYMQLLLQLGYHVTFVPVDNFLGVPIKYTQLLEKKGVYCPRRPYFTSLTEFLTQQTDNGMGSFDLVIALRYACAREVFQILDSIGDHTPRIFFPIDLHYLREERKANIDNSVEILLNSLKTKHEEFSVLIQADSICVHSDYERSHLLETMPALDVHVTPILYPVPDCTTTTFADRHDVLFVGGFRHPPNADGILWFLREVWPLVTPQLPGVRLRIAGSHMPAEITVMASDSVEILGFVEDLDPILTSTRLSIAPLRYGAGVKGKVTLSMCNGIPIIGTSIAFEGMSLVHGHEVLCADTASEFAEHLVAAYRDESLWNTLSNGAVARAQREYSISANLQLYQSIIDRAQAKQRVPHLKHKTL